MNSTFLEVIDKLAAQLRAVDIKVLASKCHTLMASDSHSIKLFTDNFIKKLFRCSDSRLLKIYLLPFITLLDNTILIKLVTAYENIAVLELLSKFSNIIDDTKPIASYLIPSFSQLIIPLDDSEYTIVAVKTFRDCSKLFLKDIMDVKIFLKSHWELTPHALHLVAIDYHYNSMYWMIPKRVQHLVENRSNQGQLELWNKGIFQIVSLPTNFFSVDNSFNEQIINHPFNFYHLSLKDSIKVSN